MRFVPNSLLLTVTLSVCLSTLPSFASQQTNGPSEASAAASVGLEVSVFLTGSLVVMGSEVVEASFANISKALNDQTKWTVTGLVADGARTKVTLRSVDNKATLELAVPTTQAVQAGLRLNGIVDAKRVGQNSFELAYQGATFGVLADPAVVYSHKRP
jgi:hypothetical protein